MSVVETAGYQVNSTLVAILQQLHLARFVCQFAISWQLNTSASVVQCIALYNFAQPVSGYSKTVNVVYFAYHLSSTALPSCLNSQVQQTGVCVHGAGSSAAEHIICPRESSS